MSRGLGIVQRKILASLQASDTWLYALDLLLLVSGKDERHDATYRAVLRAIRTLAKSGQILTAHLLVPYDDGLSHVTLCCWLPKHQPPKWQGQPVEPGWHHKLRCRQAKARTGGDAATLAAGVV